MALIRANASGVLTGTFTVPADVPVGTKRVDFIGSQGSLGSGTYTGSGEIIAQSWQQVTTNFIFQPPPQPVSSDPPVRRNQPGTVWAQPQATQNQVTTARATWETSPWGQTQRMLGLDPLAQTFTLNTARQVSAVDLKFTAKGGNSPVLVQIRETSNGFPTQNVLADAVISAANIVTNNTYVRATFGVPVFLEAGREYAVVVLTDDADHAVAVAELSKYDSFAQQWVASQPYTVGVLLSSANAITWTAHQDRDLCFRLLGANYTSTTQTISLGTAAVSNLSDLLGLAPITRPAAETDVQLVYTRSNSETFTLRPGQPLPLSSRLTESLSVSAVLRGTTELSPVVFPGTQTVAGNLTETGTYFSRQIPAGTNKTIKVIFDALIPSGATVTPAYETATAGQYTDLSSPSTLQLGDGWVEYSYTTGSVTVPNTRAKLTLTGTAAARPRVRNLRVVVV